MRDLVAFALPDGTACYGRPMAEQPGVWWLRHTTPAEVYPELEASAPEWMRRQAEQAVAGGSWDVGETIVVAEEGAC